MLQYTVRVTVGSCSMEYEYKLLRQFTTTVGGTRCSFRLKQSQSNSVQGNTKHFTWNRTEWQWLKGSWIFGSNFENKQWPTGNFFFWPCSYAVQIHRTLIYSTLQAMVWTNWHRKLYSNSIDQPPTVTRLCTVANLLLCQTTAECPL